MYENKLLVRIVSLIMCCVASIVSVGCNHNSSVSPGEGEHTHKFNCTVINKHQINVLGQSLR